MNAEANRIIRSPLDLRLGSGGGRAGSRALIRCLKCDAPCVIRSSVTQSAMVKDLHCSCTNTGCGHTFVSQLSFLHTINAGSLQCPDLDLPLCRDDEIVHILPPDKHERSPP